MRDKTSRSIASGVSHVRGFIENAQGERFFHLDKSCTNMAIDLENYRYPEAKEGKDLKPEPIKDGRHDHSMDMLRYFFINRVSIKNKEIRIRQR